MYNSGTGRYSTPNGQPSSQPSWSADGAYPTGYSHSNYSHHNQRPNTVPAHGQTPMNHVSGHQVPRPSSHPSGMPGQPSSHCQTPNSNTSSNHPQSDASNQPVGITEGDGIREPPKKFPELASMSLADLKSLSTDQTKFNEFVSNHDYRKSLKNIVTKLQHDLNELERAHASSSNEINESDIEELQRTNEILEQEVAGLRKQQTDWMEKNSPERLMERLRVAMKESTEAAGYLERSFMSKTMDVEEFLEKYVECRKTYHERSQKLEQLKQEAKRKTYGR